MVPATHHRVACVVQVRDLFAKAEAAAPCILFFDEVGKCVCCCVVLCECVRVRVCMCMSTSHHFLADCVALGSGCSSMRWRQGEAVAQLV